MRCSPPGNFFSEKISKVKFIGDPEFKGDPEFLKFSELAPLAQGTLVIPGVKNFQILSALPIFSLNLSIPLNLIDY